VTHVLVSYSTSEIAVRRRKRTSEAYSYWSILSANGEEIEAIEVPQAYKLIAFDGTHLVMTRASDESATGTWLFMSMRNGGILR
jgi:hypothetical protein